MGHAYAFFKCNAPEAAIQAELPKMRALARVPSTLDLSLTGDVRTIKGDPELTKIVEDAAANGIPFAMKGHLPNASNQGTAEEVAQVLNKAYESPLYAKGEKLYGVVLYEENGEYVPLD